jgi:cysteinyl-tRNA synthetase
VVLRIINSIYDCKLTINEGDLNDLKDYLSAFVYDILGLKDDQVGDTDNMDDLMQIIINLRNEAKKNKDFVTSDRIREHLTAVGIQLKDSKDGTLWNKI